MAQFIIYQWLLNLLVAERSNDGYIKIGLLWQLHIKPAITNTVLTKKNNVFYHILMNSYVIKSDVL